MASTVHVPTTSAPSRLPNRRRRGAPDSETRERIPVVRGIRAGGPKHRASQDDVRTIATGHFPDVYRSPAMLEVFENAQIDERSFVRPLEWYLEPRSFAEKNAVYVEEALDLSQRLATDALADAGIAPADVDAVVFVSSTGVSTPSLDAFLIQRMGIASSAVRVPLWGLGCAGGAAGLARAGDLVRAGFSNVLLVAVELCSLTFVMGDDSKSNFIGTALFADGGAALVLGAENADGATDAPSLVRLLHSHSELIDDSAAMTGWDIVEAGFKLRLSKDIPMLMATKLRGIVDASLDGLGWSLEELSAVVLHPGGAKVIDGYQAALSLSEQQLAPTRTVLREHGNMSSPTVLFVLAETLASGRRGRALVSATGPGFSAEHLLVELL